MSGRANGVRARIATAGAVAWVLLGAGLAGCGDAAEPGAAQAPAAAEDAPADASAPEDDVAPETGGVADVGDAAAPDPEAVSAAEIADGTVAGSLGTADAPEQESYWLLTEFDWGDDREVVYESTRFDPFYTCHNKAQGICALTQVTVEGEQLLADFHFNERDRLFQMVFLTPDLDREQAGKHLERVWRGLAEYVTEHRGEPVRAAPLPGLDAIALGPPQETHLWRSDGLEVRLMVGRRDTDRFYVGAFFSDPSQPEEREAQLAAMAESDRKLREQPPQRPASGDAADESEEAEAADETAPPS